MVTVKISRTKCKRNSTESPSCPVQSKKDLQKVCWMGLMTKREKSKTFTSKYKLDIDSFSCCVDWGGARA